MTWLFVILLAVLAFAATVWLFKASRRSWQAIGAALLAGMAGYALQAHPNLPGSPTPSREQAKPDAAAAIAVRQQLSPSAAGSNKWLIIADALARNGNYAAAAEVLRGAVEKNPKDSDAWLAMANALVSHSDGQLSPAALFAFRKAAAAAPGNPGPPFFLGLALAQSGRLSEGRGIWADLLARSPADAPWRKDLAQRLGQLDAFIAERAAMGNPPQ